MGQTSDSDHPNLLSGGPTSLFLIAWSQVTTTPSNNLYLGHLALIASWFTLYKAIHDMLQAVWQRLPQSTHNTKDMTIHTDIGEIIG